jgi:arylsulfatase A-like enzyme
MGQVRYVDDSVGRILDALTQSGHDRDTLVVFMSDHGELLGSHGAFHKIGVFYECLTRIPVILRHPDGLYQGVFEGLVEEVDLAPTILEACGIERPPTFVGESLHQRLVEGKQDGRETVLVEAGMQSPTWPGPFGEKQKAPFMPNQFGPGAMISDGRYKLSVYYDDTPELYDLEEDPHELHNRYNDPRLSDQQSRMMRELCRRLLGAGVRDVGLRWPGPAGDPREMPLEVAAGRNWNRKGAKDAKD